MFASCQCWRYVISFPFIYNTPFYGKPFWCWVHHCIPIHVERMPMESPSNAEFIILFRIIKNACLWKAFEFWLRASAIDWLLAFYSQHTLLALMKSHLNAGNKIRFFGKSTEWIVIYATGNPTPHYHVVFVSPVMKWLANRNRNQSNPRVYFRPIKILLFLFSLLPLMTQS